MGVVKPLASIETPCSRGRLAGGKGEAVPCLRLVALSRLVGSMDERI